MKNITMIAAVGQNRELGKDNKLEKILSRPYALLILSGIIAATFSLLVKYVKPMKDNIEKYLSLASNKEFFIDTEFNFTYVEDGIRREIDYYSKGIQQIVVLCMRFALIDCLYQDTYKTLLNQKLKNTFDSYAEEVMLNKLFKIIKDYPEYSVSMHVKLDDLISDYTGLTESELKYVKHHKTHVDFVIFDKITYKPKLCIEVDGTRYHDYYSKQIEHDEIKTRVLENNNINILRLKTNQSNEIEKIIKYL